MTTYSGAHRASVTTATGSAETWAEGAAALRPEPVDGQQPGHGVDPAGRGRIGDQRDITGLGEPWASCRRVYAAAVLSQPSSAGQPPTLGGSNGTWPRAFSTARCFWVGAGRERPQRPDHVLDRLLDQLALGQQEGGGREGRGEQRLEVKGWPVRGTSGDDDRVVRDRPARSGSRPGSGPRSATRRCASASVRRPGRRSCRSGRAPSCCRCRAAGRPPGRSSVFLL